jgi:hypothetical protein
MITLVLGLDLERAALAFWLRVRDRIERGEFPTAAGQRLCVGHWARDAPWPAGQRRRVDQCEIEDRRMAAPVWRL